MPARGAINGVVGGLPGDMADEWSAEGEHIGAWLRLTWEEPQCIDRVWLFDRPSPNLSLIFEHFCAQAQAAQGVASISDMQNVASKRCRHFSLIPTKRKCCLKQIFLFLQRLRAGQKTSGIRHNPLKMQGVGSSSRSFLSASKERHSYSPPDFPAT